MSAYHRPMSAKVRSSRPGSAPRSRVVKSNNDGVSYEDLLVAQYLEELRKSPPQNKTTGGADQYNNSPYLQRLAHTHIVPTPSMSKRPRPQSAFVISTDKPKMDPKFIADNNLWDPATPREEKKKRRPFSAPAYKRPLSATYGSSRPSSAKSSIYGGKRIKPLYKRQPHCIVVTAYKNGCRDIYMKIAAPNIKMLLEMCTDKLAMGNAARRVFLDDGTEVFTPQEIMRDAEVYISTGENFRNPYTGIKKQTQISKSATWTMNGLVWAQDSKKKATKPRLSKRFRNMIEQSRRRVLVFRNGSGSEGIEIVADPERFEDFLVACTAKLDLGSYARVLYDWGGNEVHNLNDAPVLDQCLQTWSTPVLGPLWVSKGEGFSPKGVNEFLAGLITYTKGKLKEAKHYQQQLQYVQSEETKEKVDIVAILSMSESELEETLEIVAKDIEDFSNALNRLKEQLKEIKGSCNDEEEAGNDYTLKHIPQLEGNSRMVGTQGLRLKVYENGTFDGETVFYFNLQMALRGVGNDKEMLMARLLDQCSFSGCLANPKHNPAIRPMAKKIYNKFGKEVKSVLELKYDDEIWLSFGEPWKNPFTYVLSVQFDKVKVYDIQGQRQTAVREQLMGEDIAGQDRPGRWEAVKGIPEGYSGVEVNEKMDPMEKEHIDGLLATSEIEVSNSYFLRNKQTDSLLVFAEPVVDTKKMKGNKEVWPSEAQTWVISKGGYIYSKAMPQLVLGVTDDSVKANLSHPTHGPSDTLVQGFRVSMQRKMTGSAHQQWVFTVDATIYPHSHPDMVLTYLGAQAGNEESQVINQVEGVPAGHRFFVAVCEKLEGKQAKNQRWAVKQEKMENLGQWKHTQAENSEWNKKSLSWPVKEDGEINQDYDWPMEGFLLPYAPPLQKSADKKGTMAGHIPLRLLVLKNGVRDLSKATAVVGPDLTNMRKDMHKDTKKNKTKKTAEKDDTESIDVDAMVHCDEDLTVLKLEFILFLERSTGMLDLPFAARRVFDEAGKEHFSLRSLKRDQLVYVSCGEPWSNPNMSKAEQQRRYLLANLSSDVTQIRQFISLRDPANLVLEVEAGLVPGTRLVVNESALQSEENFTASRKPQKITMETQENDIQDENMDLFNGKMKKSQTENNKQLTHHERSHQMADERLNKLKWPWEREQNGLETDGTADPEEQNYSNKDLYYKYKNKKRRGDGNASLQLQKFVYDDGFIECQGNRDLVLGVQEQESRVMEVILVKKRLDDIYQRWILTENGSIIAKHNPNMALTASLPPSTRKEEEALPMSYIACSVTLQQKKTSQFGRANQRWHLDTTTGQILAFYTDVMDKEITAANKANVCTYAVMGGTEIDQPGYVVEMQSSKGVKPKKLLVCSSCARAMRGRHKLEKVQGSVDFACAMGSAKELEVRQVGSFQCLNGKVDLSTYEAEHTLSDWEDQLARLRDELSVRAIAREISAARVPYTVKVMAYKNGGGRMKPGELIVGSSVPGILEQATYRLGLGSAARRLYTADGSIILDIDDLVIWVQNEYVEQARRNMRREAKARKLAKQAKDGAEPTQQEVTNLMGKVQLDSDTEEEETEEEQKETEDKAQSQEGEETESFMIGYDSVKREHIDQWKNCIIIPNPAEEIEASGVINEWKIYAAQTGNLSLQVYRPSPDDLTEFILVAQVTYEIPITGEIKLDVSDQPIAVKRGDMIGFHIGDKAVLAYDLDTDTNQAPYYVQPKEPPVVGQTLKMDTYVQRGMRKYSLNATVTPVPEKPEPKKVKKTKSKGPVIQAPPVEMVLRYPIEVWVSAGEQFVKPEKVEHSFEQEQQHREERAAVSFELEKEKHVLRQMQGRRFEEAAPGQFRTTRNPQKPVLVEGNWQEPSLDELQKHDIVHQLQTHLMEMKSQQKPKGIRSWNEKTTRRLYTQPTMKRVLVFPNGESIERAQYVWGESMDQLLTNSTSRLNLRKAVKYVFSIEGRLVSDFEEVEKDQLLCVSHSKQFTAPKESQQMVEIKANWGRARKQYGRHATDIVVATKRNPGVDVDPFGPSPISGGPSKSG